MLFFPSGKSRTTNAAHANLNNKIKIFDFSFLIFYFKTYGY